jgi:hypothetical protein
MFHGVDLRLVIVKRVFGGMRAATEDFTTEEYIWLPIGAPS